MTTSPEASTEPRYGAKLSDVFWLTIKSILGLMLLYSFGRLFYLWDYHSILRTEHFAKWDIPLALLSALRFDLMISTHTMLPAFILAALGLTFLPKARVERAIRVYGVAALVLSWFLVISDHYFYIYFSDHFNAFFWEFWEDFSNAALVIGGLSDSVPLGQAVLAFAAGFGFIWLFYRRVLSRHGGAPFFMNRLSRAPAGLLLLFWAIVIFMGMRATLDGRPLLIQDRRVAISTSVFINLLHTNPVLPIIRSYQERAEVRESREAMQLDENRLTQDLKILAPFAPGAKPMTTAEGYHYLAQDLTPAGPRFLKKQPKHVVLIFMESYSAWLMDFNEDGFNDALASTMQKLRREGYYFSRHFPPSAGTVKNLGTTFLGFPQPREFQPSINYHRESQKPFPGRLAVVMDELGYKPRFFYGGHAAWHRLYQFLPMMGFREQYFENSFPNLFHHPYGIYDRDLFQALHQNLMAIEGEHTFSYVMTLSNHPPYNVPEEFDNQDVKLPNSLADRLIDSRDQFYKRINGFRFADASLGAFLETAKAAPYFNDTLFVITGDHPFGGGVSYPPAWGWKEEQIPLFFYGPGVLKDEFVGKKSRAYTTHLDIMPTLAALLTDRPMTVPAWGKPVFLDGAPDDTGINFYFSCLEGVCLKNNLLYQLTHDGWFEPLEGASDAIKSRIQRLESAYYNTALHYLYRFEPVSSRQAEDSGLRP